MAINRVSAISGLRTEKKTPMMLDPVKNAIANNPNINKPKATDLETIPAYVYEPQKKTSNLGNLADMAGSNLSREKEQSPEYKNFIENQRTTGFNEQTGVLEGELQDRAWLGEKLGLLDAEKTPTTIEQIVQKHKDAAAEERAYQEKQIAAQSNIAETQYQQNKARGEATDSSYVEMFAQGREGAMSGTAPKASMKLREQVKDQLRMNEENIGMFRSEQERLEKAMDRAEEQGNEELVTQFQQDLARVKQKVLQAQSEYNTSLVQLSQEERAVQTQMRQGVEQFAGMVESGVTMDPRAILNMAQSLNIPPQVAMDYYDAAEGIRTDKSLSQQEQQIKLDQLNEEFKLWNEGYRSQTAQDIQGITKLYSEGKIDKEMAQNLLMGMKIDSSMNPITQLELAHSQADLLAKNIANEYLPRELALNLNQKEQNLSLGELDMIIKQAEAAGAPERVLLELEKARLDLKEKRMEVGFAEQEYANDLDVNAAKQATLLSGPSKYGHGEGKRECGEAYNQLTNGEGGRADNSYQSKMDLVTKQDSPQVGNGLVIPLKIGGDLTNGHIETVISSNPITNTIQTVSYNRDGKGSQTIETYNVDDLKAKYGDNWGFTDSTLKPEFADKLQSVSAPTDNQVGEVSRRKQDLIDQGFSNDAAQKQAEKEFTEKISAETEGLDLTAQQTNIYLGASRMKEAATTMDSLNLTKEQEEGLDNLVLRAQKEGELTDHGMTDVWMSKQNLDDDQRAYLNAASRWINSKLRPESGAAISASEYLDARQQYFPTYGDSQDAIEIKKKAREGVYQDYLDVLPSAATKKIMNRGPSPSDPYRAARSASEFEAQLDAEAF